MVGSQPRSDRMSHALTMLKLRPNHQVKLVVQSKSIIWIDTHWQGQQVWCAGEGCLACANQTPLRSKGYFIATLDESNGRLAVIIEVPEASVRRLEESLRFEEQSFGPGLILMAQRTAKNRPINLTFEGTDGRTLQGLNTDRRILAAAAVIAGMPIPEPEETLAQYSERSKTTAETIVAMTMRR